MRNLYEPGAASELKERIARLTPQSRRVWGKMDVAQMLAHCAAAMENATGESKPPRMLLGRVFGGLAKRQLLSDRPMGRNAPTARSLRIVDQRDLERERQRLITLIDRYVAAGPQGCTKHPHTFFGHMNPTEWAQLMYKHLDHHLTQFSV